jgi:hypothetical protein
MNTQYNQLLAVIVVLPDRGDPFPSLEYAGVAAPLNQVVPIRLNIVYLIVIT